MFFCLIFPCWPIKKNWNGSPLCLCVVWKNKREEEIKEKRDKNKKDKKRHNQNFVFLTKLELFSFFFFCNFLTQFLNFFCWIFEQVKDRQLTCVKDEKIRAIVIIRRWVWGKYESFYLKDKNELKKKQQKWQARAHSKKDILGDIRDERERKGDVLE